ncbi:MAG: cupin domain-containing protein [Gammaproteobacteria bacterium]|nr:cupin domain-containing protein [Gammaproteobacteria bacterium]
MLGVSRPSTSTEGARILQKTKATTTINADFSRCAIVTPDQFRWVPSPQIGVERVMLDRLGGESARATSIVRYAPDCYFPRHHHPGGEEILVLSGTFSEENQHYPAGWYLRSPPGSSHQPSSSKGAIIFVKLWQMKQSENHQVRINTNDPLLWQQQNDREVCLLFSNEDEQVSLHRLRPGETLFADAVDGAELLVLAGELTTAKQSYLQDSWIRLPVGRYPEFIAGAKGVTLYLKTGHLSTNVMGA